jgi:hypothetical protein
MKHEFKVIPKEEVLDNRSNAYEFIDFDKQETLEETAENYKINIIKSGRSHRVEYTQQIKLDFIAGAKWQQEQILDFLYKEITERRDYSASKMCEVVIDYIKQNK